MPRIPQYSAQVSPPRLGMPRAHFIPERDIVGAEIARSGHYLSREMLLLEIKHRDARQQKEYSESLVGVTKGFAEIVDAFRDDPDFETYEARYDEAVSALKAETLDQVQDQAVRNQLTRDFNRTYVSNWQKIKGLQRTRRVASYRGFTLNQLNTLSDLAANTTSNQEYDEVVAKGKSVIAGMTAAGIYDPLEMEKLMQDFESDTASVKVKRDIIRAVSPEELSEIAHDILDPSKTPFLAEDDRVILHERAMREHEAKIREFNRLEAKRIIEEEKALKERKSHNAGALWRLESEGNLTAQTVNRIYDDGHGLELSEYKSLLKATDPSQTTENDPDAVMDVQDRFDAGDDIGDLLNNYFATGKVTREFYTSFSEKNRSKIHGVLKEYASRLRDDIRAQQRVSGLGAITMEPGEQRRIAEAGQYFDEKIEEYGWSREGIRKAYDETMTVFESVQLRPLRMIPKLRYGPERVETLEDVKEAQDRVMDAWISRGEIDEDEANRQMGWINEHKQWIFRRMDREAAMEREKE